MGDGRQFGWFGPVPAGLVPAGRMRIRTAMPLVPVVRSLIQTPPLTPARPPFMGPCGSPGAYPCSADGPVTAYAGFGNQVVISDDLGSLGRLSNLFCKELDGVIDRLGLALAEGRRLGVATSPAYKLADGFYARETSLW